MTNSKIKFVMMALFAILFSFTANAQSCCSKKSSEKSCQKTEQTEKSCCAAVKDGEKASCKHGEKACKHKRKARKGKKNACSHNKNGEKACCNAKGETTGCNHEDESTETLAVNKDGFTNTSFTVYGNCGMCERTIEGALKDVNGIALSDWNRETDVIEVSFQPEVITLNEIKQKVADVGYDSDTHRAKDEVYNNLPGCCKYDRPAKLEE